MPEPSRKHVRIWHAGSGTLIADGRLGWQITPFENSYYISRRSLGTSGFRSSFVPGLCIYKFVYVWLDLVLPDGSKVKHLGWKYVVPNPLLPFIWFRAAVPARHPELIIERYSSVDRDSTGTTATGPSHAD